MSDIPLRHSLPLNLICASAKAALSAGHDFVFDEPASEVVCQVFEFLRSEKNRGHDYREFAMTPFARMSVTILLDGAELLYPINKGCASCYCRRPGGLEGASYEDYGEGGSGALWNDAARARHLLLTSALLILNRPRSYTISDRPACRRFVRGKLRAFAAHHLVSIDLDEKQIVRLVRNAGSGTKQRRHERRGHFSHRGGATFSCIHEWVREDYEANEHWRCSLCGRLRFWIKTYDAGDAGIGFSTKQYAITASHAMPHMMGSAS